MGKSAVSGFGCAGFHAVKALRENSPDAETGVYFTAWEAPAFASEGKMDKCDGYEVRLENGLQHMTRRLRRPNYYGY